MAKIAGVLNVVKNGAITVDRDKDNMGVGPFALVSGSTNPASFSTGYNSATSFEFDGPGFYFVSGSTTCTGTVPNPAAYPGSQLHVTMLNAAAMQLSGSATAKTKVFSWSTMAATGSVSASSPTQYGNTLTLTSQGSVSLQSNGFYWQPFVSSGSLVMGL